MDSRLEVFLHDPSEVFYSIQHRHEIWRDDPFDVASVHAEARQRFERLLAQATTPPGPPAGRILFLRGDSGSGKTHLLRAFRSIVHKGRAGFMGYMQMTSNITNYGRYALSNLIDSLDQPYDESLDPRTGLSRLSAVLASHALDPQSASMLRDDPELHDDEVIDLVMTGADHLLQRHPDVDLDVMRALLFLHRPDPRLKARILKFLRCEDLVPQDRATVGWITPKLQEEDPIQLVQTLGRIIARLGDTPQSLVLCLDQLEFAYQGDSPEVPFQRAMGAVCDLADRIPSSIIVVSCLEDFYQRFFERLTRSHRDRIAGEKPMRLEERRSLEEVERLVAARLQVLYGNASVAVVAAEPLYPFPTEFIRDQNNGQTRAVIDACRRYREDCRKASGVVPWRQPGAPSEPQATTEAPITSLEQEWNDHLAAWEESPPEAEASLAELLAWALGAAGDELESPHRFPCQAVDGVVRVEATLGGKVVERSYVALCNRTAKFGWLSKQIAQHAAAARSDETKPLLVLARNDEFPQTKAIRDAVATAIRPDGRTVVIHDSDWRTMLALKAFVKSHRGEEFLARWLAEENHVSRLTSVRRILELDRLERFAVATEPAAPEDPRPENIRPNPTPPSLVAPLSSSSSSSSLSSVVLGRTRGVLPQVVTCDARDLTRHAAFLGGTGSGKTTLALGVVEQLLLQGVPALMIDRKGDLAGYARAETWSRVVDDPVLAARRDLLREKVDVAFFTPGHPEGRPIAINVAPDGLAEMTSFEREEAVSQAALALGDMLAYRAAGRDVALRAILIKALQVLAEVADRKITIDSLVELIDTADPALVARVGRLDPRLFRQLVQDLEALKFTSTQLFGAGGESLEVDRLLGLGTHQVEGKTRLAIVSTKFLRDDAQIHFWVAQLLMSVVRWGNQKPKDSLQAVLMIDEADLYLPALRQPATKAPMENLLKRGRSAGLGILLATQSPGDLDYRCRDNIAMWFLGRIKEPTALQKIRPMVEQRPEILDRIPGQAPGEFHVVRTEGALGFQAQRSVLVTEQIADSDLLAMARRTRPVPEAGR